MKNKVMNKISLGLVATLLVGFILNPITAKAESTTEITGTVVATTFDVSVNLNTTYTINPNATDGTYLQSNDITIVNNSSAPVDVSIQDITASTSFTDYMNTDVGTGTKEDWYALGKTDSQSKIALYLTADDANSTWRNQLRTTDVFFKEILDSTDAIALGTINSGDSVVYKVGAYHGLAFDSAITNVNTVTWNFALATE